MPLQHVWFPLASFGEAVCPVVQSQGPLWTPVGRRAEEDEGRAFPKPTEPNLIGQVGFP